MSNEKMEAYKALYSKYLEYAVNLHNYHYTFLKFRGLESGRAFRACLKEMMRLDKQLQKANQAAYKEHRKNTSDRLARQRAERELKKTNKKLKKESKNG